MRWILFAILGAVQLVASLYITYRLVTLRARWSSVEYRGERMSRWFVRGFASHVLPSRDERPVCVPGE